MGRNVELASLAGKLRNDGLEWPEIETRLLEHPARNGLSVSEVRSIAKSIGKYEIHKPKRPAPGVEYDSPLHKFACIRGYSVAALESLGAQGHDNLEFNGRLHGQCITWPTRDDRDTPLGRKARKATNETFYDKKKSLAEAGKNAGLITTTEWANSGNVYICEGETKASALATAGAPLVIGTPGSKPSEEALSWISALCSYRKVYLFPDPGESGQDWLDRVGQAVVSGGGTPYFIPSVVVDIDDRLFREPNKKAALDRWTSRAVEWRSKIKAQDINSDDEPSGDGWAELVPLNIEEADIDYPIASVAAPVLQNMLFATSEIAESPIAVPAAYAFAAISYMLSNKVRVVPRPGWHEPPQLYMISAIKVGRGKSMSLQAICDPIIRIERETQERHFSGLAEAKSKRRILEGRKKKLEMQAQKCLSEEDTNRILQQIGALDAEMAELRTESVPKLITENFTPEKLGAMLSENDERIAILTDEAEMFGNLGRYSQGNTVGRQQLDLVTKGYNCIGTSIDRLGRESIYLSRPAISIGACVQPKRLMPLFKEQEFLASGFLARFLMASPKPIYNFGDPRRKPIPEDVRGQWHDFFEWLHRSPWMKLGERKNGVFDVRYSAQAECRLAEIEVETRKRNTAFGDLADIEDWATRLAGQVVRISAVLHAAKCFDSPEGRAWPWEVTVSEDTVEESWEIVQYHVWHLKKLVRGIDHDPMNNPAVQILRWCKEKGLSSFPRSEKEWRREKVCRNYERFCEGLFTLRDNGYIKEVREAGPNGRPREMVVVNPAFAAKSLDELLPVG